MAQPQNRIREGSSHARGQGEITPARSRGGSLPTMEPMDYSAGPFSLMRRLSDDMDQLFGQLVGSRGFTGGGFALQSPLGFGETADWIPALDVTEQDGEMRIQVDLPGVNLDDVEVQVDEGMLTISGERREEREIGGDGGRRSRELRYGSFSRSIALPEEARTDEVQATFRNGVLEISVPLEQRGAQRKRIEIQEGGERRAGKASTRAGQQGQSASQPGETGTTDARESASRQSSREGQSRGGQPQSRQ